MQDRRGGSLRVSLFWGFDFLLLSSLMRIEADSLAYKGLWMSENSATMWRWKWSTSITVLQYWEGDEILKALIQPTKFIMAKSVEHWRPADIFQSVHDIHYKNIRIQSLIMQYVKWKNQAIFSLEKQVNHCRTLCLSWIPVIIPIIYNRKMHLKMHKLFVPEILRNINSLCLQWWNNIFYR